MHHKKRRHTVHSVIWNGKRMEKKTTVFDCIEEALEWVEKKFCDIWKIYDEDGGLVCEKNHRHRSPYT